ncbi:MAG: hypothetical protein AAB534_02415 [Patescibacteria group bacterium]
MSLLITVSIFSGITQFLGYVAYTKDVIFEKIRPNAASWSIWAFGAVLESISYIFLTGDILKNVLPIVCAISAVLFFLLCLKRGHFEKITRFEKIIVIADIAIIIIWFLTKSPFYANLLFVITAIISFVPIIVNVYKNPTYENAFPWFIWTTAYALQTIVVVGRFEKAEDLIYPVVFFILHIIVAVLAVDARKKRHLAMIKKMHPEHL